MRESNVVGLAEPIRHITYPDAFAYIERTRRQLDRFELLPQREGATFSPDEISTILAMCDDLESDMKASLRMA